MPSEVGEQVKPHGGDDGIVPTWLDHFLQTIKSFLKDFFFITTEYLPVTLLYICTTYLLLKF